MIQPPANSSDLKTLTLILYILYICAIFTAGILAVVALIINYVKLYNVRGTIFESHFRWQIRTFWWYLIWNILAFVPFGLLFFVNHADNLFVGTALFASVFCVAVIGLSWLWTVYRAVKGLIELNQNEPMV